MKSRLLIVCLFVPVVLFSQTSDSTRSIIVTAVRTDQPIRIDGVLEEPVYRQSGTNGFTHLLLLQRNSLHFITIFGIFLQ
jgi:hypothetical protein